MGDLALPSLIRREIRRTNNCGDISRNLDILSNVITDFHYIADCDKR